MLMMTPWRQLAEGSSGGITGSPFVRAFAAVGIPFAAGAMNLVVISAAVSSANSNLYMTARMLLSLARSGYAPRSLAVVSATGVPLRAVATASTGVGAAILLAIYAPANAFLALYGTAVAGMLFIWIVILFTYLRFRAALTPEQLARLPIRMPAHRAAAWFGIVVAHRDFGHDVLRGRPAIQRGVVPAVSRADVDHVRSHAQTGSMSDQSHACQPQSSSPWTSRRSAAAFRRSRRPSASSSSTTRPARRFRTPCSTAVTDHLLVAQRAARRAVPPVARGRRDDRAGARERRGVRQRAQRRRDRVRPQRHVVHPGDQPRRRADARDRGPRSSSAISITRRTSRPGSPSSAPAPASSGGTRGWETMARGCTRRISSRC